MRQRCSLSPLLFITVLEALVRAVRSDEGVKGIRVGQKEYKLKAFTDNLVITVEYPLSSVPKALERIQEFGQVAGFRLNKVKMKMLIKKYDCTIERKVSTEINPKDQIFRGMVNCQNYIFKDNYIPM